MFFYAKKVLRHIKIQREAGEPGHTAKTKNKRITTDLNENLDHLKQIFGPSHDIVIRKFSFGPPPGRRAALIFIEGLVNSKMINENIIRPLMYDSQFIISPNEAEAFSMDDIYSNLLSVGSAEYAADLYDAAYGCLSGDAAFFAEGSDQALLLCCKGWKERSVEDPQTESVIRGPREGFTEDIRTNSSLLRRKIRDPALRLETMKIGRKTATKVTVAYLQGVAPPELIEETKYRLGRIDTDAILESGYIEQYIEDAPFSIFATVAYSEKPDVVAAKILEGRAAILVDGTPFVLTVPMLFAENFQTSEDYYVRTYYASILRLIRYLSYAITILAPAAYVALTTFHQELIPTALLFTMIAAREGIPFPAIMEAGLMIITFEIIREAGVRLPRPVGQAISIVGALVIGESAVSAGLIGAPMVIVVALTAVSSFVLPANTENDVILRIVFLILAGSMGGFGIMIGLLGLLIHLSSLRSFGTPYLSPVIPLRQENMQDVFIRKPLWSMKRRPFGIARGNINRRMDVSPPPPSPENRNCP